MITAIINVIYIIGLIKVQCFDGRGDKKMMRKKICVFGIIMMLVLTVFSSISLGLKINRITEENNLDVPPAYPLKGDTIRIYDSDDFNAYNGFYIGDGTKENPFVMENFWGLKSIVIWDTNDYFVIRNCVFHENTGFFNMDLYHVSNGVIQDCIISNVHEPLGFSNIRIGLCDNITIKRSHIKGNGIYILSLAYDNVIEDCSIEGFKIFDEVFEGGIFIQGDSCCRNTVSNCDIKNSETGVKIYDEARDNIFHHCNIENNDLGIDVKESDNNIFHHNNIISNPVQDDGINQWDDGSGEGNFWSDYREKYPDATKVGKTWDTPYKIRLSESSDNYPLVKAVEKAKNVPVPKSKTILQENQDETPDDKDLKFENCQVSISGDGFYLWAAPFYYIHVNDGTININDGEFTASSGYMHCIVFSGSKTNNPLTFEGTAGVLYYSVDEHITPKPVVKQVFQFLDKILNKFPLIARLINNQLFKL